mgnify:CR=1 FL=1
MHKSFIFSNFAVRNEKCISLYLNSYNYGILKTEFIEPIQRTLDIEAATELVGQSIYTYNRVRPHRSLDMCTPASIYYKE